MVQDDFERIEPARIDISATSNPALPEPRSGTQLRGTVVALALLFVVAAGVIFLLPGYIAGRTSQDAPAVAAPAVATPAVTPAPAPAASASPWEQAQAERERVAAKGALDALLAAQFELEERAVTNWAAAEFAQATAFAKTGDEAYRANNFPQAEQQYREGQRRLQALLDGIDARLDDRLARAESALSAGDEASATALFNEALAIDNANTPARSGLERAARLAPLRALMARGSEAEAAKDDDAAAAAYREALALEPGHEPARTALNALQSRIAQGRYTARLSAGYAALAAGRLSVARTEFQAALKEHPGGPEAREGLQQADFQLAQQRITALLATAEQARAREQWPAAVEHYTAVLAIDPALSSAREGKQDAETRLALDRALEQFGRDPQSLASDKARAAAATLLDGAAAIANPGPRLQSQLAAARARLKELGTTIPVRLRSDGNTDVTVFRVGNFGSFTTRELPLLPGNYVAVGQRGGYRDVRVEFTVRAGAAPPEVLVQCRQKI